MPSLKLCTELADYICLCAGIRAYEQLGKRAFGHPGKILAAVVITMHNIGGELKNKAGFESRCYVIYITFHYRLTEKLSLSKTLVIYDN